MSSSFRLLPRESSDRGCATLFVARRITIAKAIHTSLGGMRPMSQKTFSLITSVIFLLIAAGHVLRLAFGWKVTIAGQLIPNWVSWTAFVIAIYFASEGLRLARKPKLPHSLFASSILLSRGKASVPHLATSRLPT